MLSPRMSLPNRDIRIPDFARSDVYDAHMSKTAAWTANAIATALAAAGATKVALSEATGIPYPTLNRKLAAHRDFTLSELLSIAEALRVPPSSLIPPHFKDSRPGAAADCMEGR